jgi:hypothetical protein
MVSFPQKQNGFGGAGKELGTRAVEAVGFSLLVRQ